jgi:hypothetical protein
MQRHFFIRNRPGRGRYDRPALREAWTCACGNEVLAPTRDYLPEGWTVAYPDGGGRVVTCRECNQRGAVMANPGHSDA